MRRIVLLAMFLVLFAPLVVGAQQVVELSGYRFVPEQNLQAVSASRGAWFRQEALGTPLNWQRNALVQLAEIPTTRELELLKTAGITLVDYVGGNAYYALLDESLKPPSLGRGNRITSIVALRPEWKLGGALQPVNGKEAIGAIPDYARAGTDGAKVVIRYAQNASTPQILEALQELGLRDIEVAAPFRAVYAEMPLAAASRVAALPWVLAVGLYPPPPTLYNNQGRTIGRASVLGSPADLGGRGLKGNGVKIGIWDASIVHHVDFGERVHVQEYEMISDHGTHVAGTVLGAGLLNPDAKGMAPRAEAWTYNFNSQRNGLNNQQEMDIARGQYGITLTQNSYGIDISRYCRYLQNLGYRESDRNLDILANSHPTLTHVFAAGNEQDACSGELVAMYGHPGYGSGSTRAKNAIYVGAVNANGTMTSFSSWGPTDDGRMFPTICAKGAGVLSTVSGNAYSEMDGTSMACPTVTGHAALLSERFAQLNGGREITSSLLRAILANKATDAGRPGPDFQYGYGVMDAERAANALEQGW